MRVVAGGLKGCDVDTNDRTDESARTAQVGVPCKLSAAILEQAPRFGAPPPLPETARTDELDALVVGDHQRSGRPCVFPAARRWEAPRVRGLLQTPA